MNTAQGSSKLRVFVSSTYMDNRKRRKQVLTAIQRANGFQAIAMEWWSADERPPHVVDEERVGEADLLLLIVAHRYGAIATGHELSYTEREFDAAVAANIDILAFVVNPKVLIDVSMAFDPGPDRWDKQKKLEAFKVKVNDGKRVPQPFTDDDLVLCLTVFETGRPRSLDTATGYSTTRRCP